MLKFRTQPLIGKLMSNSATRTLNRGGAKIDTREDDSNIRFLSSLELTSLNFPSHQFGKQNLKTQAESHSVTSCPVWPNTFTLIDAQL